jgi:hypothetical protein
MRSVRQWGVWVIEGQRERRIVVGSVQEKSGGGRKVAALVEDEGRGWCLRVLCEASQQVAVHFLVASCLAALLLQFCQFYGLAVMNVQFCCDEGVQMCSSEVETNVGGRARSRDAQPTILAPIRFETTGRGSCGSTKPVTLEVQNLYHNL